jgi:thymidylate kinase
VILDPRTRELHSETNLLRPTFQILLSARPEVRIQRLEKRRAGEMRKASDVKLEDNVALLNNVADLFRGLGLSEIDTSDITPEEVVARITAITSTGG